MAFGISDEILEKITENMIYDPERDGPIQFDTTKTEAAHSDSYSAWHWDAPYPFPPNKYITASVAAISNTTDTSTGDRNVRYLLSLRQAISDVFSSNTYASFHSTEFKSLFDRYNDYIEETISAIIPDAYRVHEKSTLKVCEYVFSGVSDHVLKKMYRTKLSKPDFRNLVDDTISLMDFWGIQRGVSSHNKEAFFAYYKEYYGLKEDAFFCCPHCGAPLISGFRNCPKCYEVITDYSLSQHMRTVVLADRDIYDEPICEKQQQESISEENKKLQNANALLQEENKRLRGQINGHNVAIGAFKREKMRLDDKPKPKGRLLIIGDASLSLDEISVIADNCGINPQLIEYINDYSEIKQFAMRVKNESSYDGIIVGAVPHKVKGLGEANSLSVLFQGEGCPYTVEARTYSGELKITAESLRRAMGKMFYHLVNCGTI